MAKVKKAKGRTGAVRKPDKGKRATKRGAGSSPAAPTESSAARAKRLRKERDARYRETHRADRQKAQKLQKRRRRSQEREIREQVHEDRRAPELSDWQRAAKRMRDLAKATLGIDVTLAIDLVRPGAPAKSRGTPWAVRADLQFGTQIDYLALHELAKVWEGDRELERLIGSNRLTRMGVKYHGPVERGSRRFTTRRWVASEIAPWDACASRLATQTDEDVPGSVALRYKETTVSELQLWISHSTGREYKLS